MTKQDHIKAQGEADGYNNYSTSDKDANDALDQVINGLGYLGMEIRCGLDRGEWEKYKDSYYAGFTAGWYDADDDSMWIDRLKRGSREDK